MDRDRSAPSVFVVRVWYEPSSGGEPALRASVRDVAADREVTFTSEHDLTDYLMLRSRRPPDDV